MWRRRRWAGLTTVFGLFLFFLTFDFFQYGGGGGGLDLCQLLAIGAFLAVAAAAAAALFLQITASHTNKFSTKNESILINKKLKEKLLIKQI